MGYRGYMSVNRSGLSLLQSVYDAPALQPTSYPMGTETLFLRYSGRSVKLTPPSNARFRIYGASPPIAQTFHSAP